VNVRRFLCAACAWAFLVLAADPGAAGDQGRDEGDEQDYPAREFYGAIAYSPTTRAHGWAYDYASRGDAKRHALVQCNRHADDCIVPVWFRNACGALAVGADGYGSGWGATRKLAETYAIQSCGRYSGSCAIVRWVCTTK
jgi:serine/threonine-protein kinase